MKLNVKKIELELERIGKNQVWLAREMKVKRQWVHYLMNSTNGTTLKTIERIGKALGVDPKDLII
jgi:plasmid maintenance system antidote protein VapI